MARGSPVDLTVCADQPPRLYIAADLADSLHVTTGTSEERLHFGLRSQPITVVRTTTMPPGCAELTKSGAKALRVPHPARLHIFRTGRQDLRLGPLIGVYISSEKLAELEDGEQDSVYLRFTRYAEEIGACLVFVTRDGIRPERKIAHAHRYQNGKLQPVQVPLPRVLYDRCFGHNARGAAHWLRGVAAELGIVVVNNPVRLTKLPSYEAIASDPALKYVVPYYAPLSAAALEEAAAQYDVLYVKPSNLSKGRGVCRVYRRGKRWVMEETGSGGPVRSTYETAEEIIQDLPARGPYLIQEALDLATYLGNRYDFRALVQKNGTGEWQLSGLVARIAPLEGVVTSPRSGGLVAEALTVLEHSFGRAKGRQVLYDLTRTCIRIAMRIEEVYGLCVELGLDIGVTKDGSIRLIEANGRPLKVSLVRLNDPAINGPIIRLPINFAAALDLAEDLDHTEAVAAGR